MSEIINQLPHLNKRVMTSATQNIEIPGFVRLNNPTTVNYLDQKVVAKLEIKTVKLSSNNKLQALLDLINYLGNQQIYVQVHKLNFIIEYLVVLKQEKLKI